MKPPISFADVGTAQDNYTSAIYLNRIDVTDPNAKVAWTDSGVCFSYSQKPANATAPKWVWDLWKAQRQGG